MIWWLIVQPDATAEAVATRSDMLPEGFDERFAVHPIPYSRQWRSGALTPSAEPANAAAVRLVSLLMRRAPDAAAMRGRILVGSWADNRWGRRQYPAMAQRAQITIVRTRREGSEPAAPPDRRLLGQPLTDRELDCVEAVAEGLTFAAAAARLGVAAHIVRDDLQDAKAKLGARSTAQAVGLAVARGLIRPASYPPDRPSSHPRSGG